MEKMEDLSSERLALLLNEQYQHIMLCQQNITNINRELQKRQKDKENGNARIDKGSDKRDST